MSDYETHQGKLKPSILTKREIVQLEFINSEVPDYWDFSKEEDINEAFYDNERFVELNGKIFEIQDKMLFDEDLFQMEENSDGSFSYLVRFYNGGCGFKEALEEANDKGQK